MDIEETEPPGRAQTEIALFLRDRRPREAIVAALREAFGLEAEEEGLLTWAAFEEGFALGIGIDFPEPLPGAKEIGRGIHFLADRLRVPVLVEAGSVRVASAAEDGWLLFVPGLDEPQTVQVVELRRGLGVVHRTPAAARGAGFAFA